MSVFLIHTMLAAGPGDQEDTIWTQMLVLVILAASWGLYTLVKGKADNIKNDDQNLEEVGHYYTKSHRRFQRPKKYPSEVQNVWHRIAELPKETPANFDNTDIAGPQKGKNKSAGEKTRNLTGGMGLLGLDFLLSNVENTKGDDKNDVTMRKLSFNELLRRKNQNRIASNALKVYAVNQGYLYGKDIQTEAIRELSERTAHKRKHNG